MITLKKEYFLFIFRHKNFIYVVIIFKDCMYHCICAKKVKKTALFQKVHEKSFVLISLANMSAVKIVHMIG